MKLARRLFCSFLESSIGGVALVALVSFGVFASIFLAATAHAQGGGPQGVYSNPMTLSVCEASSPPMLVLGMPDGEFLSCSLSTMAPALQGGDETTGTLPIVVHRRSFALDPGTTWTMRDGARTLIATSADDPTNGAAVDMSATQHTFHWTSKHIDHTLTVTRNQGETADSFEARCAEELNAALRHFPQDV